MSHDPTSGLYPLFARDGYTDQEWALSSAGRCDWTDFAAGGDIEHCGQPSSPDSVYRWCARHDAAARRDYPGSYWQ